MIRTILVIDDNPLVRDVVSRMFEMRGFAVLVAEDGVQGIRLHDEHDVDAALVDVDMPRMNGVEVCRVLTQRAAEAGRSLCVWLMTGMIRPEIAESAAAAGARGVLPKPFTTDELMRAVDAELHSHAV